MVFHFYKFNNHSLKSIRNSFRNVNNTIRNKISYYSNNLQNSNQDGLLVKVIISANIVVYLNWQIGLNDYQWRNFMLENFTVSSLGVFKYHNYHTLLTAVFSHIDLSHLVFNMLAFYSFGMNSLSVLGNQRFLLLYTGGGILSSLAQIMWPYFIPKSWPAYSQYRYDSFGLGASGAVNAIIMWNILKFPNHIISLYGVIPIPAPLFGLGFLSLDLYSLYKGLAISLT